MFNGLAGKLLGIIVSGNADQPEKDSDQVIHEVPIEDDDGEWVLLDDWDDDECDLDLELTPSVNGTSTGSLSPLSTAKALGWNLTPPPCFLATSSPPHPHRRPFRGRNKYKHVKNVNPNKIKGQNPASNSEKEPSSQVRSQRPALKAHHPSNNSMDASMFSNMLIEHPSMSVYCRKISAQGQEKLASCPAALAEYQNSDSTIKENLEPPSPPGRIESKSNPCYVITGPDVCSPVAVGPAPGQRLQIRHQSQIPHNQQQTGRRRFKRQHFTIYSAEFSSKTGAKPKNGAKSPK